MIPAVLLTAQPLTVASTIRLADQLMRPWSTAMAQGARSLAPGIMSGFFLRLRANVGFGCAGRCVGHDAPIVVKSALVGPGGGFGASCGIGWRGV